MVVVRGGYSGGVRKERRRSGVTVRRERRRRSFGWYYGEDRERERMRSFWLRMEGEMEEEMER